MVLTYSLYFIGQITEVMKMLIIGTKNTLRILLYFIGNENHNVIAKTKVISQNVPRWKRSFGKYIS